MLQIGGRPLSTKGKPVAIQGPILTKAYLVTIFSSIQEIIFTQWLCTVLASVLLLLSTYVKYVFNKRFANTKTISGIFTEAGL